MLLPPLPSPLARIRTSGLWFGSRISIFPRFYFNRLDWWFLSILGVVFDGCVAFLGRSPVPAQSGANRPYRQHKILIMQNIKQ